MGNAMEHDFSELIIGRLAAAGALIERVHMQHPEMVHVGSVLRYAEECGADYRLLFSRGAPLTSDFSTVATTSDGSSSSAVTSAMN